jgi:integrase
MRTLKHPQYTYLKDGSYYFSRSVPLDLRHLYLKPRIIQALRTQSPVRAKMASRTLSAKLDDYWLGIRLQQVDIPASHLLIEQGLPSAASGLPTIEDAELLYLELKGQGRGATFLATTQRSTRYLISCLGARSLDKYSSADAAQLRRYLIEKGLKTASVKRIFSVVKAMVNFCIQEQGLGIKNAFAGIYIPPETDKVQRVPVSNASIKVLQTECKSIDDDIRHLLALISDTGMRLSEAAGLMVDDLCLDCEIPHVSLKRHPHRRLKTDASERDIPLVGASLWAARQIRGNQTSQYCFPRYTSAKGCNSNSASAAINKWLKTVAGQSVVIHGLRHSFRDRLRAVEKPQELIDQLGGWSLQSVGQGYGNGYPLEVGFKWMDKMIIQ